MPCSANQLEIISRMQCKAAIMIKGPFSFSSAFASQYSLQCLPGLSDYLRMCQVAPYVFHAELGSREHLAATAIANLLISFCSVSQIFGKSGTTGELTVK